MSYYRLAGQNFDFSCPVSELEPFEIHGTETGTAEQAVPFVPHLFPGSILISRTVGWVAGAQRQVEVFDISQGMLLKIAGCNDFLVTPHGETITQIGAQGEFNRLDRQVIAGPALVLALALRATWCLHASAVIYNENLLVFLGESGQGKSSLAASLAELAGWRLAADDILPVTLAPQHVHAWPHFPQLKLDVHAQPGPGLPERLPVRLVCVLADTDGQHPPGLEPLPSGQAVQALLGHTAGTRLFPPDLLAQHLAFCSAAVLRLPSYRLAYPHRWEAVPLIKDLLESLC